MTLDILQNEMKIAMKNKDKLRKDTISSMISNIKKAAIDKNCRNNIDEELVDDVLLRERKTMQEMIDTCPSNRAETMEEYKSKMEIIKEFAPSLVADAGEIEKMILQILSENNAQKSNKGAVMKTVMPKLKGKVDMKTASKIINEITKQ